MRRALVAPLLLVATGAAPAAIDPAEFRRGAEAVGTRPSEMMALRQAATPSPSFRLGAAFRAWRNAGTAVTYDSTHSTGDGGDAEVLAEDCTDERLAFTALETERAGLRVTRAAVAAIGGDAPELEARAMRPPAACR